MVELYDPVHDAGGMTAYRYLDDPRHLVFFLARYKHTAKMLAGKKTVLEVGCGDGFGSRIVRQHVKSLVAIDRDPRSIEVASQRPAKNWPITFHHDDIMSPKHGPYQNFGAVYALDVLEHIEPGEQETAFLRAMRGTADVAVIGTPSLESQQWASKLSKAGHVNCKTAEDLRTTLLDHWYHVFMFSVHDETLGTSFGHMAQYHLALCVA